jgi:hypothetical protein
LTDASGMIQAMRGKLSYANVMATVAVFLALGGVSYAATQLPNNSVGTKQLQKNAVTSKKVKDGSLKASDFKAGQLPRGATGPVGPQGPAGAQGPAGNVGPLPHARIRLGNHDQTVGNRDAPRVTFDQVVEDTGGMADLVNHPTTLVAPRDGLYEIDGQFIWENLEGKGRVGGSIQVLRADGASTLPDKGVSTYGFTESILQFLIQPLSEVVRLSAGQQVTLIAFQDTGATNTLSDTDEGTFLEMTWLGT